MKFKRIVLLLLLLLVASALAACGGDDDDGDGDSAGVDLSQSFGEGGLSFNYPDGWVVEYSEAEGATLASDQETLTTFQESEEPDFDNLEDSAMVMQMQPFPVPAEQASPAQMFELMTGEVSDDDTFRPGESSEVTFGDLSGVTADLEFLGEDVGGEGDLYLLRADDATIMLVIAFAREGELNEEIVEGVLNSASYSTPE